LLTNDEIRNGIVHLGKPLWEAVEAESRSPREAQERVLLQILKQNAGTIFGRDHGFKIIRSVKDYRNRVPIQTYEQLESPILAQDREQKPYLTAEQPAHYFMTSGTTGRAKYIPALKKTLEQANHRSTLFNYLHFREPKTFFGGKVLSFVGPAIDGQTPAGTPSGSLSGLLYELIPPPMIHKFVLPRQFPQILEPEARYLLMAGLALAEPEICLLVGANPAIFLKCLDIVKTRWDDLLKFLKKGEVAALGLDRDYARFLPETFAGNPDRVKTLKNTVSNPSHATFGELWPGIHTVVTWTKGSCGAVLPKVRGYFPKGARFLEMGYLASEFIGTLTIDAKTNAQLPTFYDNFFEFVEADAWDARKDKAKVLGLDEIEVGKSYQIIMTAWNGLYRYFINDIVEVTGYFNKTPTLIFVRKGKGVTDLAGEHLNEHHLTTVIHALSNEYGVDCAFFLMVGNQKTSAYTLYLETESEGTALLQEILEEGFGKANAGYEFMRRDGALEPLTLVTLRKGAGEAYKQHCLKHGQREAQYKTITLQYRQDCLFDFAPYRKGPAAGGSS